MRYHSYQYLSTLFLAIVKVMYHAFLYEFEDVVVTST